MSLTNDQITAQNFKDFYNAIRPYLNGQVPTFANAFNKSDLYSTDEKIVGTWIDGKPLYQKTIEIEISSANDIVYTPVGASIDTVASLIALRVDGGTNKTGFAFAVSTNDETNQSTIVYVTSNRATSHPNSVFSYTANQTAVIGRPVLVTIQYTKTTDTAIKVGDGNDYSTDEQIVGTWIDGKPLYQKTISGVISAINTPVIIDTLSDLDVLVEAKGNIYISASDQIPVLHGYIENANADQIRFLNGAIQVVSPFNNRLSKVVTVTIQYTKTTD